MRPEHHPGHGTLLYLISNSDVLSDVFREGLSGR